MNHFFDVGANIGQTFDWYLTRHKEYDGWKIWCFEPSVRHLPKLIQRMDQLRDRYHVVLCPFGVGGQTGTARFYTKQDPTADSFHSELYFGTRPLANAGETFSTVAAVISLPEFIKQHIPRTDKVVLKLDCEGGEYSSLRALLRSPAALARIKRILVEWHICRGNNSKQQLELCAAYRKAGKTLERWPF